VNAAQRDALERADRAYERRRAVFTILFMAAVAAVLAGVVLILGGS
jgi:hypothetical protein